MSKKIKRPKSLKTVSDLKDHALISDQDLPALDAIAEKFKLLIPPAVLNLIEDDLQGVIEKQFIPNRQELNESDHERSDPIGDGQHEKVKGLIHRYPDRCLLKVVSVCPVYCRFCFRKELIGPGKPSMTGAELHKAYEYIENHKEIWEVILTGGDPLILKPNRLAAILRSLSLIKHVEVIRIHTRMPVVDPARISEQLVNALKLDKAVYVALHANHAHEFSQEAVAACARIVDAGIPMLGQSVLLKGVNDNEEALSQLMKTLIKNRIKPYYLHHPDLAKGTGHFRLSIEEGQKLMKFLRGRFSGLCQPIYVLEIPGGAGKMPVGPCYLTKKENGQWTIEDYFGNLHSYSI